MTDNDDAAKKRDWYRHPATYVVVGFVAVSLIVGAVVIRNAQGDSVFQEAKQGELASSTPQPASGGILNTLTVDQINQIYDKYYGSYGDQPPFNKAQYTVVMKDLSPNDADYLVQGFQRSSISDLDVETLLKKNGLVYADWYNVG